ncbi:unnamed protein product [Clonostachys rosea]|uniref:Uncharacterized protein n=1 Tax=Bionectria ochroleuca TaxID=29856 RepID=A0ABY6UHA6_BIOOC|nr:unnamed protein product [Clonostachys rosea]
MGLGTKIKEALGSDKGHHRTPSQRRTAPGAYPDSVVDVPRSATVNSKTNTRTWDTTDTSAKKKSPTTTKDPHHAVENDESDEYTFSPVKETSDVHQASGFAADDDVVPPSPDSRIAENHNNNTTLSNGASGPQSPYWGDIGKADTKKDDRLNGHSVGRNGINNGIYSPRPGHASPRQYDEEDDYGAPIIATVNRGQPQIADDEDARAISMAASQLSQPTNFDGEYAPTSLPYRNGGHVNGHNGYDAVPPANGTNLYSENSYGVKRTPTVNGNNNYNSNHATGIPNPFEEDSYGVRRTPTVNGRGASPTNARGTFGPPNDLSATVHGAGYQAGNSFAEPAIKDREQSNSVGSSSNGISSPPAPKQPGADHYGPGHSGAKVLHRCEHCGGDNNITRYFSKDVVYRLS